MLHVKVNVRLRIALLALCSKYSFVNSIAQVKSSVAVANMCSASATSNVVSLRSIVLLQLHKRNSVLHIRFSSVKLIVVCFCSAVVLRLLRVSAK